MASARYGLSWSGEGFEAGLYHVGPRPPALPGVRASDWVEIPHESYIPIPKARLCEALRSHKKAQAAGVEFEHFLRLVEGLFHFYHHETLNLLKQDYQLFAPDGGEIARDGISEQELLIRERRFLGNFMKAVALGNFIPLSDSDYKRAVDQTYLLDVPVEIDWRTHDSEMLKSFIAYADGEEGRPLREELRLGSSLTTFLALPEELGTNALVFYRGIDRDQAEGRFLMQRLDIVFNRAMGILTYPIVKPIQLILDTLRRRRGVTNIVPPPLRPPAAVPDKAGSTVFQKRWLRRKNLHNLGLFNRLFAVQRLQEPVLRQVIILFRLKPRPADQQIVDLTLLRRRGAIPVSESRPKKDWTIHLKIFRNIPMADSEIIFPEKIIRMGSFDLAMLIVSVIAAVPALLDVITRGGSVGVPLLAGLAMLVSKTAGRYLRVRGRYLTKMTQNLYDKNLDNSLGVLQYLVDSLEEQEYKEAMLVYFVLWTADRAMSAAEIDDAVERFIATRFNGLEIDFEVEDALRKVVDQGDKTSQVALPIVEVEEGEMRKYRAKPLREALRLLDDRWDNLFQYR